MHQWQKDLWAGLTGSDPREMKIIMSGRQVGKYTMAQMWQEIQQPAFTKVTKATVDDAEWFTVKCNKEVAKWMREQPADMWHEHIDSNWTLYKNMFDVHEKIYTMLQLKYGHERV